jgi:hypothetical protein
MTNEDMSAMPSFWLEYDNNGQVKEFNFDGDSVSVGRDKSSGFVLDHPTVSRQHAVIVRKNGGFYLVVLSRGGMTAIDGQQVQGEVMLHDGSVIHLGQLEFRFRSNHAPPKPDGSQSQMNQSQMNQNQFGGMQGGQNQQGASSGGFGQSSTGGFGAAGQSAQNNQNSQHTQNSQGSQGGQSGGFGFGELPNSPSANAGSFGADGAQGQAGQQGAGQPGQQGAGQQGAGQSSGEQASDGQGGEAASSGEIVSWDEIASSSEATNDQDVQKKATIHERMQAKKNKDTNPVLVIVAGVAIVGLLWFTFFSGGPKPVTPGEQNKPIADQAPMTLEVTCMGESACVQKAKASYKVGIEKIDKKGAAVANLFEGYKKLLEAEKYLEKAGKTEPLPSMSELTSRKEQARAELTAIFKNERVKYHQAMKRSQHRPMAQALDAVKIYFPDKTAREHRWATSQEMDMKQKGIYPKHVYPQY